MDDKLIPDPQVCERYGVTAMTIWRWDRQRPELGFPRPIKIGKRNYRRESELVEFERRRAAATLAELVAEPAGA